MSKQDRIFVLLLVAYGALIWLRDLHWAEDASNTLPILAALPLFVLLGSPWQFRRTPLPPSTWSIAIMCGLSVLGVCLESTFVSAVAWTIALAAFLGSRLEQSHWCRVRRLLALPLLAFPWMHHEALWIGWWFRVTAARVAVAFFDVAGFTVAREGTCVFVNDVGLDIEPACSGLHALQVMLIAGSAVAFLQLGERKSYWWHIPVLVVMAWIANTTRILLVGVIAVTVDYEHARSAFHDWGGVAVLCFMFAMCMSFFGGVRRYISGRTLPAT